MEKDDANRRSVNEFQEDASPSRVEEGQNRLYGHEEEPIPDVEEETGATGLQHNTLERTSLSSTSYDSTESGTGSASSFATNEARSIQSMAKPSRASSAAKMKSRSLFEGEVPELDGAGLTLLDDRYNNTKRNYDELFKSLNDAAFKTLLQLCALMSSYEKNFPVNRGASQTPKDAPEEHLKKMEKELRALTRRTAESKRDQAHLLAQINDLEVIMYRWHEEDFLRDILNKVPTEDDLRKLELIKSVMIERKKLEKEIKKLGCEIQSINKALANADVIIGQSAAIKKPRRVVIRTNETPPKLGESSSEFASRRSAQTSSPDFPSRAGQNNENGQNPNASEDRELNQFESANASEVDRVRNGNDQAHEPKQ